jgi:hypothetical protein
LLYIRECSASVDFAVHHSTYDSPKQTGLAGMLQYKSPCPAPSPSQKIQNTLASLPYKRMFFEDGSVKGNRHRLGYLALTWRCGA